MNWRHALDEEAKAWTIVGKNELRIFIMNMLRDWIFLDNKTSKPERFSRWQMVLVSLLTLFAAISQLWGVGEPYMRAYETGFQELIARRHIDPGLDVTHGLSTLNNLGPEPTYHATHPPLLQLSLAALFAMLGDSEGVARIIPIFSFWAMLAGVWVLTRPLSPNARIAALAAALASPISVYMGRIVNFEAPTVACIVWTMVCIESLNRRSNTAAWIGSIALGVCGTAIDWPYPLFVMSLFLLGWLRCDRDPRYYKAVGILWGVSMGVACIYVASVYGAGVLQGMAQHAKIQTGMLDASKGFQLPPFLTSFQWWSRLFGVVSRMGTPILAGSLAIWIFAMWRRKRYANDLSHWCLVLFAFCAAYMGIFSRASHNHTWCLFYIAPLLSLCFGVVLNRLRAWVVYALLSGVIFFASGMIQELRFKTPLLDSVRAGRAIASAAQCLSVFQRDRLSGPLLYVNRVDPLPYYARCETAFSHLSVKVAEPDKFLIRHRPEFVVLSGYKKRSSVTVRPEYSPALFERLNKSYTLVHQQEQMEIWESLWSPHLSIMGFMNANIVSPFATRFVDDLDEVHVGARIDAKFSPLTFDLRQVSQLGRRWLHGWVIGYCKPYLEPIPIAVRDDAGRTVGVISALPQKARPRWQEFWLPVGDLPKSLEFSWQKGSVVFGDIRLMNEILWSQDLTRVVASEIRRRLGEKAYRESFPMYDGGVNGVAVLQHPGMGVDAIDIPPFRAGMNQKLHVTYGLAPAAYSNSDGVTFRLYVRDHALGRRDMLFEEFIDPKERSNVDPWRTRSFSLSEHSRHVLGFTFEVDAGPAGNSNSDHAMWRSIRIVDSNAADL